MASPIPREKRSTAPCLSIDRRQRGSPESKRAGARHGATGVEG